jgi:hypothetical protein
VKITLSTRSTTDGQLTYEPLPDSAAWFGTRAHVPNQAVARQEPKVWACIELHQKL